MKKVSFPEFVSWLFIFLFIYAAFSKLIDFQKFQIQLRQSPLLTNFATWIVWMVPVSEVLIAVLLATLKFRMAGLYMSFSFMVMFTGYIIAITQFSDYVPCSCGGILAALNWNQHLVFNIFFVIMALLAVLLTPKASVNV